MKTAGSPASAITPCSDTVNGSARRIHWAIARLPPGRPASTRSGRLDRALQRQRRRAGPSDHGHDPRPLRRARRRGRRARARRRSARRSRRRPTRCAPVNPSVAPEVETSTSVRRSSRARNTRASSSIAAVADSSGEPGAARARRGGRRSTIRRLDSPGRTPTTVSTVAGRTSASRGTPGGPVRSARAERAGRRGRRARCRRPMPVRAVRERAPRARAASCAAASCRRTRARR